MDLNPQTIHIAKRFETGAGLNTVNGELMLNLGIVTAEGTFLCTMSADSGRELAAFIVDSLDKGDQFLQGKVV